MFINYEKRTKKKNNKIKLSKNKDHFTHTKTAPNKKNLN